MHCKTMFSPFLGRFFLVSKRTLLFFGRRVILWMVHIGRTRHPGRGPRSFTPGQLSIEFVNVGGWLTSGDLALDSCAQFLAVAEHRLIPSGARSVCHQFRRAGHHSVWAPACQDQVAGGHAGVGVVRLGGALLSLPSCVIPQLKVFFRLGRVLRTTLPTGKEGVVHLFVVYGYQEAEEDADQLQLTDKLLQAVLAEAQVVCIGQPMLIAGDLNADPAVISCLANGISAGRYVDLALAYSLGAGSRRAFFVGCPNALAASHACYVTDRWFTPHFSVLARFRIGAWMADVACTIACQPIWPACLLNTPDRSSSSSTRVVQDVWDVKSDELAVVPEEVVLALRDAATRSSVDDFWSTWSRSAELGLFRACSKAGGPTEACSSAILGRGLLRIRSRRLGGRAVGGRGSSRLYRVCQGDEVDVHCAQYFVSCSVVDALNLWQMFSEVLGVRVLLSLGGMLFWVIGVLYFVMVREVLFLHFIPGMIGFLLIFMASIGGFLIPLRCSMASLSRLLLVVGILGFVSGSTGSGRISPSPFLVVKDPQTGSSRILVEPHVIDAEFQNAWMPFFCTSGHSVVTPDQFLDFVGHLLPQEPYLDLSRITGRDLQEVARAKKSTAGGLDGWTWNEIKALPLPRFSWSQGLLDAYIAMIPKVDGDSTPFGQRLLSVLPVVYRLWAPFGLDICGSGLRGGCLNRCIA